MKSSRYDFVSTETTASMPPLLTAMLLQLLTALGIAVFLALVLSAFGLTLGINRALAYGLLRLFNSLARSGLLRDDHIPTESDDDDEINDRATKRMELNGHLNEDIPFEFDSIIAAVMKGLEAVINDRVTASFESVDQVTVWNLLARNQQFVRFPSYRLRAFYIAGIFIRYCLLLPFRLVLFNAVMTWLATSVLIMKVARRILCDATCEWLSEFLSIGLFRLMARVFSAIVVDHGNPHVNPNSGHSTVGKRNFEEEKISFDF
ncbi:hypothetical protein ACOME3_006623 [Neoechinorhynchus agilis]